MVNGTSIDPEFRRYAATCAKWRNDSPCSAMKLGSSDVPRKELRNAVAKQDRPCEQRGLLDEIDEEVREGRDLLRNLR